MHASLLSTDPCSLCSTLLRALQGPQVRCLWHYWQQFLSFDISMLTQPRILGMPGTGRVSRGPKVTQRGACFVTDEGAKHESAGGVPGRTGRVRRLAGCAWAAETGSRSASAVLRLPVCGRTLPPVAPARQMPAPPLSSPAMIGQGNI
jgi:hypothetical protein